MKTDGPQSLHEGSDLSWKVPGEQAHSLHRGRCSLQEAALQRASLVWTGASSHCGRSSAVRPPLTSPAGTRTQGPCLSPSPPRQAGLKAGATLSKSEKHTKCTAKPLQIKPGPLPQPASLPGSMPSASQLAPGSQLTPGTRSHVSCAGSPRGRV